ncbi:MAG: histidine kinase [Bacteroidales bacterium]|nr:histidine kinase [Bacteroidales bacterium]
MQPADELMFFEILDQFTKAGCNFRKFEGLKPKTITTIMEPMNKAVFRNSLVRWSALLVTGAICGFWIDAGFALIYPWHRVFSSWSSYLYPIAGVLLGGEIFRLVIFRLNKSHPWEVNLLKRFLIEFCWGAVLSLVITTGIRWIWILAFSGDIFVRFADELFITLFGILITAGIVLMDLGIFLFRKWRDSQLQVERFKKESAESQFETLRAQVNPHFLFNNLNTLSSLIYEDPAKAGQFIREMSDVYRYILDTRDKETVCLRDDLAFLRSYMYLLELRYENRLFLNIRLEDEHRERHIIPGALQLLIENAIKHNIISGTRPLSIDLSVDEHDYMVVSNNLQKKDKSEPSSGFGLNSIISRYAYLTGKPVQVEENDSFFIVKIPLLD